MTGAGTTTGATGGAGRTRRHERPEDAGARDDLVEDGERTKPERRVGRGSCERSARNE